MGRSNIVTIEVKETPTVMTGYVIFKVTYDGKPVENAIVELITKSLPVVKYTLPQTNNYGITSLNVYEIAPETVSYDYELLKNWFKEQKWLIWAYKDNSDIAYWKCDVSFEIEKEYELTLKKYTKEPTFFITFELKDVIGAELFGSLLVEIEKLQLQFQGLKVTKIEGSGTKKITIYFIPPFEKHSPLTIMFSATTGFVIAVITLVAGIISTFILLKWIFGESAPAIASVALLIVGLSLLLYERRKKE